MLLFYYFLGFRWLRVQLRFAISTNPAAVIPISTAAALSTSTRGTSKSNSAGFYQTTKTNANLFDYILEQFTVADSIQRKNVGEQLHSGTRDGADVATSTRNAQQQSETAAAELIL